METGKLQCENGTGGTHPVTYATNREFWDKFYKDFSLDRPSDFAQFSSDRFAPGTILDLGCGNGRDLHFFQALGLNAEGKDKSTTGEDAAEVSGYWDNLYMRWFLHSIPVEVEDAIFKNITFKKCFIEVRSDKDTPNPDHYRRLFNGHDFLKKLMGLGYTIEFYCESQGLSVLNGEDPWLIRVICSSGSASL